MSGSGGGNVFKFPRLPSWKMTSFDLDLFSLRLFSAAQAAMLSISAALALILAAEMTIKVSVISELDEYVVVVERSEIACCDSVGG